MVAITFPDQQTRRRAIGTIAGRFPGRVLGTGEVLVPEPALELLAAENLTFTVLGQATYEQMASIRSNATNAVQ